MLIRLRSTASRTVLACAAIIALSSSHGVAGETIVDNTLGFTLTLPDDFEPNDDLAAVAPNAIHAFVLGDPSDDQVDVMLFIENLRGVIGRERLAEKLPPGFQGRLFVTHWRGFEVEAFEIPEQVDGVEFVTYNVQIPLKRSAIQVRLFGPTARQPELRRLLSETLTGLEGESNWLPSAAPS